MRTKTKITFFVMAVLLMVLGIIGSFGTLKINAVLANNSVNTNVVSASTIEIANRYAVTNDAVLPENPNLYSAPDMGGTLDITGVLKTTLLAIYRDYDNRYTGNYICKNMFQYFTKLDLSNITYGTSEKVEFGDFDYLYLPNLKELNLSNNSLAEFNVGVLPAVEYNTEEKKYEVSPGSPADVIETFDVSNNKLTGELDLTVLRNVKSVNVANNKLETVKVNADLSGDVYLDYRNNKIESIDNMVLPTTATTKLILFGNPYSASTPFTSNVSVEIGLYNIGEEITSDTRIKFIAFNTLQITTNIYTKTVNAQTEEVTYTLYNYNPNNLTNFEFALPAGYYKVEHVENGSLEVLSSTEILVRPPIATYYFDIKGEKYDTYTNKISRGYVCFNMDKNGNVLNPNIKVYYRYNNYDPWIEGNKADLSKKNGTYTLYFKTVENGIESESLGVFVSVAYGKYIPDILIVLLVIVFIVFLALVVVPLIKKLLDKISK